MRVTPLAWADVDVPRYAEIWANEQSVGEIDQRHRWRHDRGVESRALVRHVHRVNEECNLKCALLEPSLDPCKYIIPFLVPVTLYETVGK